MNLLTASSLIASFLCTRRGEKVRVGQKLKRSSRLFACRRKVATKKRDNEITLNMFIRTSTRWEQGTLTKILTSRILKTEQRSGNSNILISISFQMCFLYSVYLIGIRSHTPSPVSGGPRSDNAPPKTWLWKKSNHLTQDTALVTWRQNGEDCLWLPMSKKFNKQWHFFMRFRHSLQQRTCMPANLAKNTRVSRLKLLTLNETCCPHQRNAYHRLVDQVY